MAGHKLWTNLPAEKAYRLAKRAAKELEFDIRSLGDDAFAAQKGNMVLSFFVGAFVAYCDFRVYVDEFEEETEIRIERNSPWWTGLIGINRVKSRAKELANAIADRIEDQRGKVLDEKDF